jgi:parallel beta-helix repeat protein
MKKWLIVLAMLITIPISFAETVITSLPYTIPSSGVYVLNSDLSGGSIVIQKGNVVLDGKGHKISNGNIIVQHSKNVTIKNIVVFNGSNFGILLQSCENCVLSDITANNNKHWGIFLQSSDNNKLSNIIAENNGHWGIQLQSSDNNTFNGLKTSGNGDCGVCLSSSKNNTFYNWQISDGWYNCGKINDTTGYMGNIFYTSGTTTNPTKAPIPPIAIALILITIPIIALRKLN